MSTARCGAAVMPRDQQPSRPLGFALLAALLTVYALAGITLALVMLRDRDPRLRWPVLAATGGLFGIATGAAALSLWRAEPRAAGLLVASAVAGAAVCIALPVSAPRTASTSDLWRAALTGAALFAGFLLLMAWYVRRRSRPPT